MLMSQHAQYQALRTDTNKWNAATINVINYTCVVAVVACQHVCCETALAVEVVADMPQC